MARPNFPRTVAEFRSRFVTEDALKSYAAAKRQIMPGASTDSTKVSTTGPKTPISQPDDESGS